jgi:hypothetical protein
VVAVAAFGLVACSGSAPVPEQTSAAGGGADAEGSPSASASSAGGAPDAVPADPTAEGGSPTARVADGLQALYTFDAGEGTVVPDVSQVGAPADLVIAEPAKVEWSPTGLTLSSATMLVASEPAKKIAIACMATNEITIEAWVTPTKLDAPAGGARIVTLSIDDENRDFMLGQRDAAYLVRLRTTETNANGSHPWALTPEGAVELHQQHVVYTRGAGGTARFYVNGAKGEGQPIPGDLSTWSKIYDLALGDELTGGREWLGTYHLVAIYDRALTAAEVAQNYAAGATGHVP